MLQFLTPMIRLVSNILHAAAFVLFLRTSVLPHPFLLCRKHSAKAKASCFPAMGAAIYPRECRCRGDFSKLQCMNASEEQLTDCTVTFLCLPCLPRCCWASWCGGQPLQNLHGLTHRLCPARVWPHGHLHQVWKANE